MKYMRRPNKSLQVCDDILQGVFDMLTWLTESFSGAGMKITDYDVVEVGTFIGESAAIFSPYFRHVYTIDPWNIEFLRSVAVEPNLTEQQLFDYFAETTKGCKNITQIRQPSILAAQGFADHTIGFVYIDGWHRAFPVLVDVLAWLPKVMPGGYIGGHDYWNLNFSEVIPVVRSAFGEPDKIFKDTSWIKRIPSVEEMTKWKE